MKNMLLLSWFICLTACGTSSSGNESVGQIKKVTNETPLICPDYTEVDVSLGVIRNGVGSMSKEDLILAIDNSERDTITKLKKAAEDGSIVKFNYDIRRIAPCWPDHRLASDITVESTPTK